MAFQVSPGVLIQERDLSTIIPAVATTPAGIVGNFQWGPANQRIIVSSENDLVTLFGLPDNNTANYFFTASNFLQYGNNLQVVRAIGNAVNSFAGISGFSAATSIDNSDDYAAQVTNTQLGTQNIYTGLSSCFFAAKYPGVFGNSLKIEVCDTTAGFQSWSLSGQFSSPPETSNYVSDNSGNLSAGDEIHIAVIDVEGRFSGGVKNTVIEKFQGLSKCFDAKTSLGDTNYYIDVLNRDSRYIWAINHIPGIDAKALASVAFGTTSAQFGSISNMSGGTANILGSTITFNTAAARYSGTAGFASFGLTAGTSVAPTTSGIASLYSTYFGDPDTVDVSLLLGGPLSGSDAQLVADVAEARKDCVAFFSTPNNNPTNTSTQNVNNCITLKNAIGSNSYAFIDSSYKFQYDRYNNVNRFVPSNGDVAGLCVRTDAITDPWYSPAGFNRGRLRNVIKLAFNANQTERDTIYPKGINPLVTFAGEGTILYGDKTALSKPSAFDRINVRRLFIVLEKAIAIAAKYQLFEFNDNFTRAMFVSMVEPFLRDVQARRGITDFKVICDETNNTPQVIDANRFVADIFIKPARSINFIQLNFIATRTGVNFEEITGLQTPQ